MMNILENKRRIKHPNIPLQSAVEVFLFTKMKSSLTPLYSMQKD